jgi:hypothetical protein
MGRKIITKMTYDQLQDERETNELAKNQLKAEAKKETDSQVLLRLSQQILALAKRNDKLVKQQLILAKEKLTVLKTSITEPEPEKVTVSKKGKLKKPIDMSIEELQAESEANNARCEGLEKKRRSSDFDTRFQADQEIKNLSNRTKKLCEQEISLLKH